MTSSTLDQRYGKRPARRRPRARVRGWLIALALLLCAAFVAWLALGQSTGPTAQEVSYHLLSPERASLDFELTKEDDEVVTCAVQALDEQHTIVGWKEITVGKVPAKDLNNKTSVQHADLRLISPAHTVTVDSCWVK